MVLASDGADDDWVCHRGLYEIDAHPTLHDALGHLRELAAVDPPAEVFAHYLDGRVESMFTLE